VGAKLFLKICETAQNYNNLYEQKDTTVTRILMDQGYMFILRSIKYWGKPPPSAVAGWNVCWYICTKHHAI